MTYPNPAVSAAIRERFIPLRLHLHHDRAVVRPLGVFWTPTILFADRSGKVRYQSVNFLPPLEFLGILDIGEALTRMRWREYDTAIARLSDAERRDPDGPLAPEALYWLGTAAYFQAGNDSRASKAIWRDLVARFPDSIWAKRVP